MEKKLETTTALLMRIKSSIIDRGTLDDGWSIVRRTDFEDEVLETGLDYSSMLKRKRMYRLLEVAKVLDIPDKLEEITEFAENSKGSINSALKEMMDKLNIRGGGQNVS